ncbi:PIN domain-containing protein [Ornithinibacillus xuwenensis]|uniref:PIN domain-containing protein n=1 Tax=Ornithinibacillus xuwenensis TaxID=3144668 RepID=A0ABU9XL67_9BACI
MLLAIVVGMITKWLDIQDIYQIIIYILSVILFANFYRVKQSSSIEQGKAGFLSVLVPGLGHIYARKVVLGFVIILLQFILYFISIGFDNETMLIAWIGLTILAAIHANRTAGKMEDVLAKQSLQKLAVMKYRRLEEAIQKGIAIAPDTNILMHEQLMLIAAYRDSNMKLYISKQVMRELDGLKSNDDPGTRKSAQIGFDVLELYQEAGRCEFLEVPSKEYLNRHHLNGGPDEKIIASCLKLLEKNVPVIFVSNDKGARILARNSKMPTVSL